MQPDTANMAFCGRRNTQGFAGFYWSDNTNNGMDRLTWMNDYTSFSACQAIAFKAYTFELMVAFSDPNTCHNMILQLNYVTGAVIRSQYTGTAPQDYV